MLCSFSGDQHAKQRKLMNPAFSFTVFPDFFNIFLLNVHKVKRKYLFRKVMMNNNSFKAGQHLGDNDT